MLGTDRSRPAWDDDPVVARWPGLPQLDTDVSADVCVVGLGGSGLAAISELVDRGHDVVGIDAGRIAAGAAGRNGGFLLGGPATFLHEALAAWGPCAVDLYRATLDEIDSLHRVLGSDVISRTGSIRLARCRMSPMRKTVLRSHSACARTILQSRNTLASWGMESSCPRTRS